VLRIYFTSSWGSVQTDARSFAPAEGPVLAGTDENATLPLFGFQLPADSYPIADWQGETARVFPPVGATLELSRRGEGFHPVADAQLSRDGERAFVPVERGTTLRIRNGEVLLEVHVDLQRERAPREKRKALFWMAVMLIATIGGPIAFLLAGPDPDLPARALTEARIKNGLPAKPEPLNLDPVDPPPEAKPRGMVLPTSVR
jgi:hypothetical protein